MANVAIRWYNDLTAGRKRPNGHQTMNDAVFMVYNDLIPGRKRPNGHQTMNVTVFMVYNDLTAGRKRTGESKEGRKVGNAF